MTLPFHMHLVSDSTGETINTVARACLAQFEGVQVELHVWSLIKSPTQLNAVIEAIRVLPGPVLYTVVDEALRRDLERACRAMGTPSVPILDRPIAMLSAFFGVETVGKPGRQHELSPEYFKRIAAMDFAMRCDDGQSEEYYREADIILVGVSRTSKTPTSVILAQRGIKAANIPLVPGRPFNESLVALKKPLFVGLINDPRKLSEVRRSRLEHLGQIPSTDYVDVDAIREEIRNARRLYTKHRWPVIDVSRRSIEETAAQVMILYNKRQAELTAGEPAPAAPGAAPGAAPEAAPGEAPGEAPETQNSDTTPNAG